MPGLAGDFFLGKLLEVHRRHSGRTLARSETQDVVHDQSRTCIFSISSALRNVSPSSCHKALTGPCCRSAGFAT